MKRGWDHIFEQETTGRLLNPTKEVDVNQAYDSIVRKKLYEVMELLRMPTKINKTG